MILDMKRLYSNGDDGRNRRQNGGRTVGKVDENISTNTVSDAGYLCITTHGKIVKAAEAVEQ